MWYSTRIACFRTFEDARLEIVTYVEAKFRLRIRDSKPRDTVTRGQSGPMDVDAVNSLTSAVEHIFIETAMHAKATASIHLARANRASHGPRVRAKERVRK